MPPESPTPWQTKTRSLSSDSAGRRIWRQVNGDFGFVAHSGNMEIAEYQVTSSPTVGGELTWVYAITQRYVPGAGVDQRVAMINTNSSGAAVSRHYYHVNRLGSVIALANDSGVVTDHYIYTPFGVEEPLSTSGNPFRYTGRRYDASSGLYYYRARYYAPWLGRFLETDPIGYADQLNLYAYVGNNPLNATDPTGMQMRRGHNVNVQRSYDEQGNLQEVRLVIRGTIGRRGVSLTGAVSWVNRTNEGWNASFIDGNGVTWVADTGLTLIPEEPAWGGTGADLDLVPCRRACNPMGQLVVVGRAAAHGRDVEVTPYVDRRDTPPHEFGHHLDLDYADMPRVDQGNPDAAHAADGSGSLMSYDRVRSLTLDDLQRAVEEWE